MAYTFDPARARAMLNRAWNATEARDRVVRGSAPVEAKVRMAIALYEAAKATRPDWPTEADRRADLAHHLEVRAILRQYERARAR